MQSRKRQARLKKTNKPAAETTVIKAMQTTDEEDEQFEVTVGTELVDGEEAQVVERRATVKDSEAGSLSGD